MTITRAAVDRYARCEERCPHDLACGLTWAELQIEPEGYEIPDWWHEPVPDLGIPAERPPAANLLSGWHQILRVRAESHANDPTLRRRQRT